jgi:hypothetical protein
MQRTAFFSLIVISLIINACGQNSGSENTGLQPGATTEAAKDTLSKVKLGTNPWMTDPCSILTNDEFYRTLGVDPKRDFANQFTLKDRSYCLRTWKKLDWREREALEMKDPQHSYNPQNKLAINVINLLHAEGAKVQFEDHKKYKKRGLTEEIQGLGDGALWSDDERFLYVNKGHLNFLIELDMLDSARANMPKAIEVAKLVIAKVQ